MTYTSTWSKYNFGTCSRQRRANLRDGFSFRSATKAAKKYYSPSVRPTVWRFLPTTSMRTCMQLYIGHRLTLAGWDRLDTSGAADRSRRAVKSKRNTNLFESFGTARCPHRAYQAFLNHLESGSHSQAVPSVCPTPNFNSRVSFRLSTSQLFSISPFAQSWICNILCSNPNHITLGHISVPKLDFCPSHSTSRMEIVPIMASIDNSVQR